MNGRNCRSCGNIFNYVVGQVICPACREKMEQKFQEVKEYIRSHKGVGINEVAEACDVDVAQIRQWLKDDRLEVTEDSAIYLTCEACGSPIRSGRFCEKCAGNMSRGFQELLKENKAAQAKPAKDDGQGPKMRFLK